MQIQTLIKMYDHKDQLVITKKLVSPTEGTIERLMDFYPEVVYCKRETIYIK
jgi:F420-0:gamma-glutamyl ligase